MEVGVAEILVFIPLLLAGFNRIVDIRIIGGLNSCALLQVKRDVALEVNGTGKISAGRKINGSAAGGAGGINSFINGGGVERFAIAHSPILFNAENFGPQLTGGEP